MSIFSPYNLLDGLALTKEQGPTQILIAGDLYPGGRSERMLSQGQDEIWGDIMNINTSHDVSIVNLECALTHAQTRITKAGPNLIADPLCARGLKRGGFSVATLANNHTFDMGVAGLLDTMAACRDAGLETVGAGKTIDEATNPLYIKINNIRIAILSVAEHEFSMATHDSAGVWPLDLIDNYHQIQEAKQESDFVLLILHGGNEYYPLPGPRMLKTCRFFADAGVNTVICHHIHVPSGLEIYNGVPIVYSTGNFIFDYGKPVSPEWFNGYLVSLNIKQNAVTKIRLIPYWQYLTREGVQLMDDQNAHGFIEKVIGLSSIISDSNRLVSEWEKFCSSKHNVYISRILALNRIEQALFRKLRIWPFWRLRRNQIPTLLNLFDCESHRDVALATLYAELKN